MSSATAVTGRGGTFSVDGSAVARITQWAVNPTLASSSEWGDSDSGGYTNRAPGRRDYTFTAEGKYDSDDSILTVFVPGDIVAAVLGSNGPSYTFARAMCTDFNLTVNVDTEEVIGWSSNWGSDGNPSG